MTRKNDEKMLKTLVGPYQKHCDGYSNKGGNGYLCAITLHTAISDKNLQSRFIDISKLYELNGFDLAEAREAYLGQINMITVSSFSGPMGYLWGLDLAVHEKIKNDRRLLLLDSMDIRRHDGEKIEIYNGDPLLEASKDLFGTIESPKNLHFPPMPGAHVLCVNQFYYSKPHEKYVFCGLGIGIPINSCDATLFMQFASGIDGRSVDERVLKNEIENILAQSVVEVGKNQQVLYKEIYVCSQIQKVPSGKFGSAFSAVPYVVLPKDAIPNNDVTQLSEITLSEWVGIVEDRFICNC